MGKKMEKIWSDVQIQLKLFRLSRCCQPRRTYLYPARQVDLENSFVHCLRQILPYFESPLRKGLLVLLHT